MGSSREEIARDIIVAYIGKMDEITIVNGVNKLVQLSSVIETVFTKVNECMDNLYGRRD